MGWLSAGILLTNTQFARDDTHVNLTTRNFNVTLFLSTPIG